MNCVHAGRECGTGGRDGEREAGSSAFLCILAGFVQARSNLGLILWVEHNFEVGVHLPDS